MCNGGIPMVCPKCAFEYPDGARECPRCGVIFSKIRETTDERIRHARSGKTEIVMKHNQPGGNLAWLKERLLTVGPEDSGLMVAGRTLVYLVLLVWGACLMTSSISSNYAGESFLHLINLPFHEAGHVIFAPFGRFLQTLGGTISQCLIPFIVLCAFVLKGNPFGGAVGLWWLGENFLDIAPYIGDARAGQLLLLGGVTGSEVEDYHDWEVILTRLGWMRHDQLIAGISFGVGVALMLLSLAWGGYLLWLQFRNARNQS